MTQISCNSLQNSGMLKSLFFSLKLFSYGSHEYCSNLMTVGHAKTNPQFRINESKLAIDCIPK